MDLEQTVKDLRTRINRLRNQLAETQDNTTTQETKEPSAAEAYKARLMNKRSS